MGVMEHPLDRMVSIFLEGMMSEDIYLDVPLREAFATTIGKLRNLELLGTRFVPIIGGHSCRLL